MSLPHATTTIAIVRAPVADEYAEPYSGTSTEGFDEVASGVRAVIDPSSGAERVGGGEQTVGEFRLNADPCPLLRTDHVRDERTGTVYRVEWVHHYVGLGANDHVTASVRLVEGLV